MTEEATYPSYSESGRYIGNYDASDVAHVFHGGARITGGVWGRLTLCPISQTPSFHFQEMRGCSNRGHIRLCAFETKGASDQ